MGDSARNFNRRRQVGLLILLECLQVFLQLLRTKSTDLDQGFTNIQMIVPLRGQHLLNLGRGDNAKFDRHVAKLQVFTALSQIDTFDLGYGHKFHVHHHFTELEIGLFLQVDGLQQGISVYHTLFDQKLTKKFYCHARLSPLFCCTENLQLL